MPFWAIMARQSLGPLPSVSHPLPSASSSPSISLLEDSCFVPSCPEPSHADTSAIGRRQLAALGLLSALGPLAIDAYLPGFTAMAEDLDTDASTVQLTLTAFLFGLALGQLVIGTLSDWYGRRRPLLIPLRFVQGFTGAAGVVIAQPEPPTTVGSASWPWDP